MLGPAARRRAVGAISAGYPGAVAISALNGSGFPGLLEAVDQASRGEVVKVELLVPYGREGVLADLRRIGGGGGPPDVGGGPHPPGVVPPPAARRLEPSAAGTGRS